MQVNTSKRRVALYARVSTSTQTVENQLAELREIAQRQGWSIVAELSDEGISGSKGRDKRPSFDQLLKRATRREFDLIMVWALSRLASVFPASVAECQGWPASIGNGGRHGPEYALPQPSHFGLGEALP